MSGIQQNTRSTPSLPTPILQQGIRTGGTFQQHTVQPNSTSRYLVKKNELKVKIPFIGRKGGLSVDIVTYPPEDQRKVGKQKFQSHQKNPDMLSKLQLFDETPDGGAIISTEAFYLRVTNGPDVEYVEGQSYFCLSFYIMNRAAGTKPEGDRAVGLTFKLCFSHPFTYDQTMTIEIEKCRNSPRPGDSVWLKGVMDLMPESTKRSIFTFLCERAQEALDTMPSDTPPAKRRKLEGYVCAINYQLAQPTQQTVAYRSLSSQSQRAPFSTPHTGTPGTVVSTVGSTGVSDILDIDIDEFLASFERGNLSFVDMLADAMTSPGSRATASFPRCCDDASEQILLEATMAGKAVPADVDHAVGC